MRHAIKAFLFILMSGGLALGSSTSKDDNITPSSVNQNLTFDTGSAATVKTKNETAASSTQNMVLATGNNAGSGDSGSVVVTPGIATSGGRGVIGFYNSLFNFNISTTLAGWGVATSSLIFDSDLFPGNHTSNGFVIGSSDTIDGTRPVDMALVAGSAASGGNANGADVWLVGGTGGTGGGNGGSVTLVTGIPGEGGGSVGGGILLNTDATASVPQQTGVIKLNGIGQIQLKTSNGSATVIDTTEVYLNNTLLSTQQTTAPTIVANAAAGSTATASVGTGSTDTAGTITVTPSGTGITTGSQLTLTFHQAYNAGSFIVITPANNNSATAEATLGVYVTSNTTTFSIFLLSALTTGSAYIWNYHVIGRI